MFEKRGIARELGIADEVTLPDYLIVNEEDLTFDPEDPSKDLVDDYIFIRRKLRYSVAACEAVLQSALRDMATNPGARSVEGCSAIIKTITECTNQLLSLHEKRKKIFLIKTEDKPIEEEPDSDDKTLKCRVDEIIESFNKKNDEEVEDEE